MKQVLKIYRLSRFVVLLSVLMNSAIAESFTVVREKLQQGGFVLARVPENAFVLRDGVRLPVTREGDFMMGFARDEAPRVALQVCLRADVCEKVVLKIAKRTYRIQNVRGVPPRTVTPTKAEQKRIDADNAATLAARKGAWWAARSKKEQAAFAEKFILPVDAETSGVYGSSRTYNGEERSWHKGHDLAAVTGTPIKAPADGVVRLARDTFMSGNLIMLDHGGGLTTVYAHLSRMKVKTGDVVARGDEIGAVGTTGRSTGPHLHWGMYWGEIAIDPAPWVGL